MTRFRDREFFQSLADYETPKGALGASLGIHALLLAFLIMLPLLAPQVLHVNNHTMMLAPPPEPRHVDETPLRLPPPPKPLLKPVLEAHKFPVPKLAAPEPVRIPQPTPKPVPVAAVPAAPPVIEPKPTPPPTPRVVTNVFSNATSATPTTAPSRVADVAGFGDVNGARGFAHTKTENIARLGGFDPGIGEGSRGGTGNRGAGTVLDAGFGSSGNARAGTATRGAIADAGFGGSGGTKPSKGNRNAISDAGFSTAASAPKTPAATRKPADQGNIDKPVEITLKPRPDYTDEARKMRIEGEVLLRVLFTASGEVRVLDLIEGLGSGLNENAKRAAEHIQFKPAQRQGQPVDSTAIVHIVFQLAY